LVKAFKELDNGVNKLKQTMNKRIAILRGINVGGKRKILMADLRLLFENLGFSDVETYIQSGNVIFNTVNKITDIEIADRIEKEIADKYGFDVPIILRTAAELEQTVKSNSFYQNTDIDIKLLHLTFLKEEPTEENKLKVELINIEPDKFIIKGKDVFILSEGKYHKSKLTNNFFERKLKGPATTRNWNTVLKLLELSR